MGKKSKKQVLVPNSDFSRKLFSALDYCKRESLYYNKKHSYKPYSDEIKTKSLKFFIEYCWKEGIDFNIFIIPPIGKYKKFKEPIAIFPSVFRCKETGENWRIENNVAFRGGFSRLDDFLKNEEMTFHMDGLISTTLPIMKNIKKVPFSLLIKSQPEFMDFKKNYLTPLKSPLYKMGIIEEKRGKIKRIPDLRKIRDEFIIKQYLDLKGKGRVSINTIRERCRRVGDQDEKAEKDINPLLVKAFFCENSTIRRVIKKFIKK